MGFGGFLLWAGLAPLDEGVPTQGMVTLDTKRKTVQHLSGGIVKEVLVQEGQQVKEGQPLLRLDGAVAKANYEAVRQRYLGYRAMQRGQRVYIPGFMNWAMAQSMRFTPRNLATKVVKTLTRPIA